MYYVSWNEFELLAIELSKKIIESNKKYTSIVCVSRGGLLLGRILSGILDIPLGVISAKKIDEKYVVDDYISSLYEIKGDILLVDDVFDENAQKIQKKIKEIKKGVKKISYACIFYKSEIFIPDYFIKKIDDITIIFPYQEISLRKNFYYSLE